MAVKFAKKIHVGVQLESRWRSVPICFFIVSARRRFK